MSLQTMGDEIEQRNSAFPNSAEGHLKLVITYLQIFLCDLLCDFLSSAWLLESRLYRKLIDSGSLLC